jgi:hypothetical protein
MVRLTWSEQRRQFGRACTAGLEPKEVKTLMPRCQKCMTVELQERGLRAMRPLRRFR